MPVRMSRDVEPLRLRERRRIAIDCANEHRNRLPLADYLPAHVDITRGGERVRSLGRRVVTQPFLHRPNNPFRMLLEQHEFARVPQEGEPCICNHGDPWPVTGCKTAKIKTSQSSAGKKTMPAPWGGRHGLN